MGAKKRMRKYMLGCNWSLALKRMIIENKINIDYIKAGEQKDFLESVSEIRMFKPILLHGGLGYSIRTGITDIEKIK